MTSTLIIAGSLAGKALHQLLQSSTAQNATVVEFDTILNRTHYPRVSTWLSDDQLVTDDDARAINRSARELLNFFLDRDTPGNGIPTHRAFRAACLPTHAWRLAVPYLLNLHLAQRAMETARFDQVIVAAGNGINFAAWKEATTRHQIPLTLLPLESRRLTLRRRIWKSWHRWRKSKPSVLSAPPEKQDSLSPSSGILCTSERLTRLLAEEANISDLPLITLPKTDQTVGNTAEISAKAKLYQEWWQRWQKDHLDDAAIVDQPGTQAILKAVGELCVRDAYPQHVILYERARQRLEQLRPRLLLCDTQIGTLERQWSLVAQELGIPVAAYVYDQMPDPKLSFTPDYLFCDSGRSVKISQNRGISETCILPVRSHRQPLSPSSHPSASKRPLVLYADTYSAGINALYRPRPSYRCYQQIIEAARQLPQVDFAIKFHPLRGKKREEISFLVLDETELAQRKQFIRDLRPPANLRLIEPEIRLTDLLPETSVLLNLNSTAGLEAFQMGIPVIFLQSPAPNSMGFPHIHEFEACAAPNTDESLTSLIQRLIESPEQREAQIRRQQRYLEAFYWPANPPLSDGVRACMERLETVT